MRIMPLETFVALVLARGRRYAQGVLPARTIAPAGPRCQVSGSGYRVVFEEIISSAAARDGSPRALSPDRRASTAPDPVHPLWRARHDRRPVRDAVLARLCAVPRAEGQGHRC